MLAHGDQNVSPTAIYAALADIQLGGSEPFVDGQFQGGECRIFKVSFQDHQSLSVRVNHPRPGSQQDIIDNVDMDVRVFRTLEAKGFKWSPRYRGASLTFDNSICYPFIVLDWADGDPLRWDDDFPPRRIRDGLLAQLARIQVDLITCTAEIRSATAAEFFERRIKNQLKRVKDGKLPGLAEKDCLDQLALLPKILGQDGDSTVFAVAHGDLKASNIIIDRKNNIQCIIDWGFAAMVPVVQAAKLPDLLWTGEATRAPSQAMLNDRRAYTDSFTAQESQAAVVMRRWQAAKDADFRTLYLESMSSKGMLLSMAQVGWKLPYCNFDEEG